MYLPLDTRTQLCPNTTNKPELDNKEACGQRPTERTAMGILLSSLYSAGRRTETPLCIHCPEHFFFFISLATIHELQIKIMRFHWLSGF